MKPGGILAGNEDRTTNPARWEVKRIDSGFQLNAWAAGVPSDQIFALRVEQYTDRYFAFLRAPLKADEVWDPFAPQNKKAKAPTTRQIPKEIKQLEATGRFPPVHRKFASANLLVIELRRVLNFWGSEGAFDFQEVPDPPVFTLIPFVAPLVCTAFAGA